MLTKDVAITPSLERMRQHYPAFDWIRLLLAIEVMRCHYFSPRWMIIPCVPAFLAISGFLVPQSFEVSRSWGHFAWKRALRILPAYLVTLIALMTIGGWELVKGNLLMYLSSGFIVDGYNGSVWSLGAEELAYILLAILFIAGAYRRPYVIWALCVISACFMLLTDYPGILDDGHAAIFRVQCLPYAFFVGNLAYIYRKELPSSPWVGVLLLLIGTVIARFGYTAFATLFIAPGIITIGSAANVKRFPKNVDLSYGVYLWHEIWLHLLTGLPGVALLATLLSSILSFFLIERPALRLKNWRLSGLLEPT